MTGPYPVFFPLNLNTEGSFVKENRGGPQPKGAVCRGGRPGKTADEKAGARMSARYSYGIYPAFAGRTILYRERALLPISHGTHVSVTSSGLKGSATMRVVAVTLRSIQGVNVPPYPVNAITSRFVV
jgi:hypothetical protein